MAVRQVRMALLGLPAMLIATTTLVRLWTQAAPDAQQRGRHGQAALS